MNIYFTIESVNKLSNVITNVKSFYIFDVQEFISSLNINPEKPANVYFINNSIVDTISNASHLKKYNGIIYINRNLSESLYRSMKTKFSGNNGIDKFVLIDNGNTNRLKHLYTVFDEVIFFDRFRKTKIVECNINVNGNMIDFSHSFVDDRFPVVEF